MNHLLGAAVLANAGIEHQLASRGNKVKRYKRSHIVLWFGDKFRVKSKKLKRDSKGRLQRR